ncbi:DUF2313 domain-containing protein [Candidatus Saccharibacteria bacterium]|nr:DUF2313 domain-containing protein [Candidatus Saccharibacteria bacterium]
MGRNLLDPREYLPDLYKDIREIDILSDAEQCVLSYIREEYLKILANQFVLTANAEGIVRFESILGIVPDHTLDIESRRQRVLSKMATSTIFTLKILKQNLKEMCDKGEYVLSMNYDSFFMDLKVRMGKKGMLDVLYDLLYTMLPAHVGFYIHNHLPAIGTGGTYTAAAMRVRKVYHAIDALAFNGRTRLTVSPALSTRTSVKEVLVDGIDEKVATALEIKASGAVSVSARSAITDKIKETLKTKQELTPAAAVAVAHIVKT